MTITLTHPTDPSITWTSGFRGKRPNWVKAILEANPNMLPNAPKEEVFVPSTDPNVVRYWKWNGLNDEDGKGSAITTPCIVGAKTPSDARIALNKTFRTPVMDNEWNTCWKEISAKDVLLGGKEGAFMLNKKTNTWEERKNLYAASSNSGKQLALNQ